MTRLQTRFITPALLLISRRANNLSGKLRWPPWRYRKEKGRRKKEKWSEWDERPAFLVTSIAYYAAYGQ
jgi:hypothetical protein